MDTIALHGLTFKVEHIPDPDAGAPWENNDTLGTVSGWECRDHYRGSAWIGAHWSPYNRRWCINVLPCVTLWVALSGGRAP